MKTLDLESHIHGEDCGHSIIKHGAHYGYIVDGRLHCEISAVKKVLVEHSLESKFLIQCSTLRNAKKLDCHKHNETCGHEALIHEDHHDYLVDGFIHHPHEDHCDHYSSIDIVQEDSKEFRSPYFEIDKEKYSNVKRRHNIVNKKSSNIPIYKDKESWRFIIMISIIGSYFLVELICGIIFDALSLVADAMHMLTDFIALFVGFYSLRASRKTRTNEATFGWTRMEVIGGLINACFLVSIVFTIVLESIQKIVDKHAGHNLLKGNNPRNLVIVASVGLALNLIGMFLFGHNHAGHDHDHGHAGNHSHEHEHENDEKPKLNSKEKKERSFNIKAVFLHIMGDTLVSVAVIISGLTIMFSNLEEKYLVLIDPICSLIISVIILATAIPVLRGTISVLLEKVPKKINLTDLEEKIEDIPGVHDLHDFHIWQLSHSKIIGSCHIILEEGADFVRVSEEMKKLFHEFGVHSTSIQPEFHASMINKNDKNNCFDIVCSSNQCVENACCQPFEKTETDPAVGNNSKPDDDGSV